MLGGDRRRIELANSLMMTLPGTPVIRYGDEIGMGDDLALAERDALRTPMQWSDGKNGGFSTSETPILPPIGSGPYGFDILNVARQRSDEGSLLNWMERIIRMRKELPEIGWGDYRVLDTSPGVLALRYDWQEHVSVFVHNLQDCRMEVAIAPGDEPRATGRLTCVLTQESYEPEEDGAYAVVLEPYGYRWLRAGGLDELPQPDSMFA
jgi:maltose alpha-D-glucosyltransferase/alpha-amylase